MRPSGAQPGGGTAIRALFATIIVLLLALPASPVAAQQRPGCVFQNAFLTLRDQIPDAVGDCLGDEYEAGPVWQQDTSGGTLIWRTADGRTEFRSHEGRGWVLNGANRVEPVIAAAKARPPVSGRVVPTGYVHPVVPAPDPAARFTCLQANPSCLNDPWWIEWNQTQGDELVQFEFVGPGLTAEARFIEAVWLLWKWPEGQHLLSEAADNGVTLVSDRSTVRAFASYQPSSRKITIYRRWVETSTWMVAVILAHELQHASDHRAGHLAARTYDQCIAVEQSAYRAEWRFLRWLSDRFKGLPSANLVASRLSREDFQLYRNLYEIATSPDVNAQALEDYRRSCS